MMTTDETMVALLKNPGIFLIQLKIPHTQTLNTISNKGSAPAIIVFVKNIDAYISLSATSSRLMH